MWKDTRIYLCDDTVDGVLSAVYEAGISGYGHEYIRIQPRKPGEALELTLFADYVTVESDSEKSARVAEAVRSKISYQAYFYMMNAAASCFDDRADAIYQFVTYGFTMGSKVCGAMQLPCVQRIFEIKRAVANETHFWREFMRFQEINEKPAVLLAVFEPKHRVVSMVTEHFADRFNAENFIIFDKSHMEAAFHAASGEWEVRHLLEDEAGKLESLSEQKEEYVDLWCAFFDSIAIKERENKNLQRNLMPLHYRKHVTEFNRG